MPPVMIGRDLTRGPLARNLFAVAWPGAVSSLLQTLYNLADAFWLGKLGKAALAAPTVTMHISFISFSVAMGLGVGGTTLVSQYKGAGRPAEMSRAAGQTLALLMGAGVAIGLLGLAFSAPLLRLLQTPPDAYAGTLVFLRWILAGVPFTFVFFVFSSISTGLGDTLAPLRINLITVALNAILDPILIFGWGPVPPLGVGGAALATTFCQMLSAAMGLQRLMHSEGGLRLNSADLRWHKPTILRILKIGVPMSLGQTGTALGFTVLIGVVNTFGSAVTAAFGVGNRIINMAMAPAMGLSQACAAAVGQNLGAQRPDRAAQAVWTGARMLTAILLPITVLTFFFGDAISRVFINDPEVVQYGRDLFQVTSFSVFAFGFVLVLLGAFRGSGHTVPVMVLNMARLWGVRVPGAWFLAKTLRLGPAGIWWAMFVSNMATAIAAAIWFSTGTWKRTAIETEAEPKVLDQAPLTVDD
jgi:putative MATE family efflux protein